MESGLNMKTSSLLVMIAKIEHHLNINSRINYCKPSTNPIVTNFVKGQKNYTSFKKAEVYGFGIG